MLGGHPTSDGVVFRCFKPGAEWVRVLPEGHDPFRCGGRTRKGSSREPSSAPSSLRRTSSRSATRAGRSSSSTTPTRSSPRSASSTSTSFAEGRHEELQRVLGAHPRELEGVAGVAFAVWAPERALRQRRRRLQLLGRPPPPDAKPRGVRHLGALRARGGRRRRLQVRDPDAGRLAPAQGRSARGPHRGAAADRFGRRSGSGTPGPDDGLAPAPRGRTGLGGADVDLRGAPRLVALELARRAIAR